MPALNNLISRRHGKQEPAPAAGFRQLLDASTELREGLRQGKPHAHRTSAVSHKPRIALRQDQGRLLPHWLREADNCRICFGITNMPSCSGNSCNPWLASCLCCARLLACVMHRQPAGAITENPELYMDDDLSFHPQQLPDTRMFDALLPCCRPSSGCTYHRTASSKWGLHEQKTAVSFLPSYTITQTSKVPHHRSSGLHQTCYGFLLDQAPVAIIQGQDVRSRCHRLAKSGTDCNLKLGKSGQPQWGAATFGESISCASLSRPKNGWQWGKPHAKTASNLRRRVDDDGDTWLCSPGLPQCLGTS
jgi:hypothetical protein